MTEELALTDLLILSGVLARMAWTVVSELATVETELESIAREEFMPDMYFAKSQTAVHRDRECGGLANAN